MNILYWTYEADEHCCQCAEKRFGESLFAVSRAIERDTFGHGEEFHSNVSAEAIDDEGNAVMPVYNVDTPQIERGVYCGTCHAEIIEANPEERISIHICYGDTGQNESESGFDSRREATERLIDLLAEIHKIEETIAESEGQTHEEYYEDGALSVYGMVDIDYYVQGDYSATDQFFVDYRESLRDNLA